MRSSLRILGAVSLALAGLISGHATTFAKLSVEQLAAAAPLIVRARCVGSIVEMRGGEIYTETSFEVREIWKGTAPPLVRVRLLGGRTAELTSRVPGVPGFQPGEDVILFLSPRSSGDLSVVSWAQGTFRIRRAAATGQLVVTQDTAGSLVFNPISKTFESSGVRGKPLDEFRAQIASALSARGPSSQELGRRP